MGTALKNNRQKYSQGIATIYTFQYYFISNNFLFNFYYMILYIFNMVNHFIIAQQSLNFRKKTAVKFNIFYLAQNFHLINSKFYYTI